MALVVFVLPQSVFAQASETQCTCFCANPKVGAQEGGAEKMTATACEAACEAKNLRMTVCAKTARQFPANNALCFDEKGCGEQNGVLAKQQAPECPTGWSYCFPTAEKSKVKLSIKIGALDEVGDLGDYVSGVYKWMLGVAGFFAIVMVMIGGLQWVMSAGGAGSIEKAKERMRNGVMGMILLFCVVLILQTVNPQLLKLELPRPSKIRIVNLASNSCEGLLEQGYKLKLEDGSKEECGGIAVIEKGPKDTQVADGLTCQFTKCAKGACVAKGTNDGGVCTECRYVSKDNPNSPGTPSPKVCFGLAVLNAKEGMYNYCDYQGGGVLNTSSGNSIIGGLDADTCFETVVDCSKIKTCDDYDDEVTVYYFDDSKLKSDELDNIYPTKLGEVCITDPCNAYVGDGEKCEWSGNDACD